MFKRYGSMFVSVLAFHSLLLFSVQCQGKDKNQAEAKNKREIVAADTAAARQNPPSAPESQKTKVTFIELGSVNCVPCKMMQPVMKSVEQKYGDQVKVVFHDVWTPQGEPYAQQYGIQAIPTQVFLDGEGKEFYRHMGFFPEEELVKVLQSKGVK